MKYTVKDVVCDYGVYEDDMLLVVLNDYSNAKLIAEILNADLAHKKYSSILEDLNTEIIKRDRKIEEQKAIIFELGKSKEANECECALNFKLSEKLIETVVLKTISDISKTSISKTRGI